MDNQKGRLQQLCNKWTKGERHFSRPPLPPELRGRTGCRMDKGVIDQDVGPEVFITILEQSEFSQKLAAINPFTVYAKTGLTNTDYGSIIF